MKKARFTKLKTNRLLLRNLEPKDWKAVSFLRSDTSVNQFVDRPIATSKEEALLFITKISTGIADESLFYWSISLKDQDRMIGSICLWNFSEDKVTAEIGFDLTPDCQSKGIMSEALKSVLTFGFHDLKLKNIEAYTHYLNLSSKKLLEKNNFKLIIHKKDPHNKNNIVYILEHKNHQL
ncbi:(ribosomal protein S5)-alanine N-acetyltransferase [Tenacibaculum sp. 190524A02b]|uniref:(Ribosomal protein S5)-alanine N-acetyltransferase n=1 Tax=Tenacibaculum vairaonense TaxID=3137860 RepID=A0ABP1F7C0_9FLAO